MRLPLFHWIIPAVVVLIVVGTIFSLTRQRQTIPLPEIVSKSIPHLSTSPPYPSHILDLTNWKVTLPLENPENLEQPLEIETPKLATYKKAPWFMPTLDEKSVIFRAPVNAPTTGGSDYPRSELREMTENGKTNAVWSSEKGNHSMFLDQAITAVPARKPHIVAGQIHGDDDDILVIRLEYPTLYLGRSKSNLATLDENYTLGKRFTVRFAVSDGNMQIYYNGSAAPIYTLEKKVDEAYFKAGAYVQSNCETEETPDLCNENNYGEVTIYQLTVTHH